MIVKKIDIENYKGFEQQEISFNDNLNVFIGANASGKTSVLEAIVKCLYRLIGNGEQTKLLPNPHDEIMYGKYSYKTTLHIKNFENKIVQAHLSVEPDFYSDPSFINYYIKGIEREKITKFINVNSSTVPIIKYYHTDQKKFERNGKNDIHIDMKDNFKMMPQMNVWSNIYDERKSYIQFVDWFYEYENEELRQQRNKVNFNFENSRLKYIRNAVEQALYKIYNKKYVLKSYNKYVSPISFSYPESKNFIRGLSLKLKNDDSAHEEDLEAKSDGEKAIITLVADIAYNLALAHDFESDENYLNSPGIVLIDEIEQHLHPNWQRKIIPILTSVFPKIQFFITTHSPQVISSVNSEHVFLCQDFTVGKVYLKTKGVDSNALLTFLFNSTERPKEYMDLINEFDELLDNDADIAELEGIIEKVIELENEDTGNNISGLVSDLELQLEAYKFELEHEMD